MNWRNLSKIDPQERYWATAIECRFGISRCTLRRWVKSGRLIPCQTNPRIVTGQRLIEAIDDRNRRA